MISKNIFRSYDIRGVYPSEVNEEAVFNVAKTLARDFFGSGEVVVAHDARLSSPSLYKEVISVIKKEADFKVIEIGLSTTPMFYFSVVKNSASGGIMVTASHNPKEYNGLKMVRAGAEMISGKEVLELMTSDQ